jgi:uncharacterized protein (TIGR03437 family)
MRKSRHALRFLDLLTVVFWFGVGSSQQSGIPTIVVEEIPDYGSTGAMSGRVLNADPSAMFLVAYIFVPDMGWYTKSSCSQPFTPISPDGTWAVDLATEVVDPVATKVAAYLFPSAAHPNCLFAAASIPFASEQLALARVKYERPNPNPRSFFFSGLEWAVKGNKVPVFPGPTVPNFFSDNPSNAWVDSSGRLHLRVTRCGDTWCSAEVFTKDPVGYGSYRFVVESAITSLDSNAVLGLFTWSDDAEYNNREIDIEFSRWGNLSDARNAQYVVQPYSVPGNLYRFSVPPSANTAHSFTWQQGSVNFTSSFAGGAPSIAQWSYGTPQAVPLTGKTRLHINFYQMDSRPPQNRLEQEVVVSRVEYVPLAPTVSLSSAQASLPFVAGRNSVGVAAATSGCAWIAESTAPWIKLLTASGVGNGSIGYSVDDNAGSSRSGMILLDSPNCNVAQGFGSQRVFQAANACDVRPLAAESFTDFREKLVSFALAANSPACRWTVQSGAPWISLLSSAAGTGPASVNYAVAANPEALVRQGALVVGPYLHRVTQDGRLNSFAIIPNPATVCDGSGLVAVGLSWSAGGTTEVDVRTESPDGPSIGRFSASGWTSTGKWVADGTRFYLQRVEFGQSNGAVRTLAVSAARVSIEGCGQGPLRSVGASGIVNGASFSPLPLAPGSMAAVFGVNFARQPEAATSTPLPLEMSGTTVRINGERCPLIYVSPTQINFVVPDGVPMGRSSLQIGEVVSDVAISPVAPGIFTVMGTGQGVPFASGLRVKPGGEAVPLPVYQCGGSPQTCSPVPIDMGEDSDQVLLTIYATGLRGRSDLSNVRCNIGGLPAEVRYAGSQASFAGLDQINVRLPRGLVGRGGVQLVVDADGVQSNRVDLAIK